MFDKHTGWEPLSGALRKELEPYDIVIIEIKEKWGELRVQYTYTGPGVQPPEIKEIIERYAALADQICMFCGGTGSLEKLPTGVLAVICRDCFNRCKKDYSHE